ncbi:MAG: hypothetical protein ABJC13_22395 [Acidobacteriota bacterium]
MKASSYSDKIDAFQNTVNNLEPDLPKYPGAADIFDEMKVLLAELRPAHAAVESHRGSQRVAVQMRRDLAVRGVQVHRRLSALVAAHIGFANPVLATYGITPENNANRRGRRSKKELAAKKAAEAQLAAA